MNILNRYPELAKQFETLCKIRRNEILSYMIETDAVYENLCHKRADTSMALRDADDGSDADSLLEAYSDAVYAQEVYELDALYRQGFLDALTTLYEQGLL